MQKRLLRVRKQGTDSYTLLVTQLYEYLLIPFNLPAESMFENYNKYSTTSKPYQNNYFESCLSVSCTANIIQQRRSAELNRTSVFPIYLCLWRVLPSRMYELWVGMDYTISEGQTVMVDRGPGGV
jgi:hypothetical protein